MTDLPPFDPDATVKGVRLPFPRIFGSDLRVGDLVKIVGWSRPIRILDLRPLPEKDRSAPMFAWGARLARCDELACEVLIDNSVSYTVLERAEG